MDLVIAVLLGLLLPIAWGLGSAWAFDKIRERRATHANGQSDSGGGNG